jgi:hypothetical protein
MQRTRILRGLSTGRASIPHHEREAAAEDLPDVVLQREHEHHEDHGPSHHACALVHARADGLPAHLLKQCKQDVPTVEREDGQQVEDGEHEADQPDEPDDLHEAVAGDLVIGGADGHHGAHLLTGLRVGEQLPHAGDIGLQFLLTQFGIETAEKNERRSRIVVDGLRVNVFRSEANR